jgi:hypothetical protein
VYQSAHAAAASRRSPLVALPHRLLPTHAKSLSSIVLSPASNFPPAHSARRLTNIPFANILFWVIFVLCEEGGTAPHSSIAGFWLFG